MPKSSRHRSHRSRKRSRGCSDSEEEESLRERTIREEEATGGRVSRDLMPEKQRSSHEHAGKDMVSSSNGDVSSEKKRKTREDEEVVVADRWNGGMENDGKRSKNEDFGPMESDKSSKAKTNDTKSRSSRRNDGSNERNEDRGGRNDSMKGKSEKDSNQRERSYHYKDEKERVNNKDKEAQDSRHEKSEDQYNRKHGSKILSNNEEHGLKKNAKINAAESQVHDLLSGAETEKGSQKHTRRDDTEDKDKWLEDSRDADGRRLSSRDHSRSRSHKDERHENTKYKGKYTNENDRDQNHHDDKNQDERLSKDRLSDKSDRFHLRHENKSLDGYRKIKLQDTNQDDAYVDVRDTKLKDRRRRYSNEKDDPGDPKPRATKERQEVDKNASSASRTTYNDKPRSGYRTEKSESSPKNKQFKGFTSSITHAGNDINRDMRYEDSGHRVLSPEERRPHTIAKGDSMTSSGFRDRNAAPRSGKLTMKDDIHSGELLIETVASSKYDRAPRSDDCSSPNQCKGRSSSTKSSHRIYERSPSKYERAYRQNLDTEIIQRNASYNEGGVYDSEKPIPDDISQAVGSARETTPLGSSSIYSSNISDRSPNHLRPPPSSRVGIDNPSVLGPYQEDNKAHSNDRRSYSRYKRTSELGFERGHGNAWKGAPNWSAPATNVFMPLQHGPPPGFHPAMPHFPPPMFGVRPMDLAHGGVSYHMHEMAERFSGHGRPFGWHNSVEQLCNPQMQMWDRTNGMFGNESHMYGRQEWDENGQLMGSRGWEMGSEMWKDHNVNNMDPALRKEQSSTQSLMGELVQSKCLPTESIGGKQSSDTTTSKNDMESPHEAVTMKTFRSSHMLENKVNYVANYLSRIDISSDLAGLELYERCASQVGIPNTKDVCSLTNSRCFQMNKDGKIEKMDTSYILKPFYTRAKDDVFKKAMSLYRKQSIGYVKPVAPETVCSEETKRLVSEASENEVVQDGCHSASLVEPPPFADDPTEGNMQVENDLGSDHVVSDVVSGAVAHDAVESIASLSRIPDSDENTH